MRLSGVANLIQRIEKLGNKTLKFLQTPSDADHHFIQWSVVFDRLGERSFDVIKHRVGNRNHTDQGFAELTEQLDVPYVTGPVQLASKVDRCLGLILMVVEGGGEVLSHQSTPSPKFPCCDYPRHCNFGLDPVYLCAYFTVLLLFSDGAVLKCLVDHRPSEGEYGEQSLGPGGGGRPPCEWLANTHGAVDRVRHRNPLSLVEPRA